MITSLISHTLIRIQLVIFVGMILKIDLIADTQIYALHSLAAELHEEVDNKIYFYFRPLLASADAKDRPCIPSDNNLSIPKDNLYNGLQLVFHWIFKSDSIKHFSHLNEDKEKDDAQ